ncbi:retrovirus-related Pol polyprotein from transposon 412 [Trichonephila clavipes]|nr:retrovirus-related Pol polyprotein from transposon 412 [Trichonephila clavipes]
MQKLKLYLRGRRPPINTKNELKERMEKGQEDLRNTLGKKIDSVKENLVKDLLQNTDLDEKQRCAAGGLVKEFQSLFSKTSEDFGRTRLMKHRIDTGEHPPIKQHPRRLPFAKQEEVQRLIKDMKNNDVIEP